MHSFLTHIWSHTDIIICINSFTFMNIIFLCFTIMTLCIHVCIWCFLFHNIFSERIEPFSFLPIMHLDPTCVPTIVLLFFCIACHSVRCKVNSPALLLSAFWFLWLPMNEYVFYVCQWDLLFWQLIHHVFIHCFVYPILVNFQEVFICHKH